MNAWKTYGQPRIKGFHYRVENVIKQLVHESAVRSLRYEALGKFGEHPCTHLSCTPNFPRGSYRDERTLTHEPVVNWLPKNNFALHGRVLSARKDMCLFTQDLRSCHVSSMEIGGNIQLKLS